MKLIEQSHNFWVGVACGGVPTTHRVAEMEVTIWDETQVSCRCNGPIISDDSCTTLCAGNFPRSSLNLKSRRLYADYADTASWAKNKVAKTDLAKNQLGGYTTWANTPSGQIERFGEKSYSFKKFELSTVSTG